jgi:hypothetical protein
MNLVSIGLGNVASIDSLSQGAFSMPVESVQIGLAWGQRTM